MPETKVCRKCKIEKSLDRMVKVHNYCKECDAKRQKINRRNNPERYRAYEKKKDRVKIRIQSKIWRDKNIPSRKQLFERDFMVVQPTATWIKRGYRHLYFPTPYIRTIPEHVWILSKHIGRLIKYPSEQVHHIDGNRLNNKATNLRIVPSGFSHTTKDELTTALKTIASQDQEIARLKELLNHKDEGVIKCV